MSIKYNLNELDDNTMNYRFDFFCGKLVVHFKWEKSFDLLFFILLISNCCVFVQIISNSMPMYVNICVRTALHARHAHIDSRVLVVVRLLRLFTLIVFCMLRSHASNVLAFAAHTNSNGGLCLSRANTLRLYIKTTRT